MRNYDMQKAFFALLNSGLWNVPVTQTDFFNGQTDWKGILLLAEKQGVLGLVADAIFRLPEDCQPKQQVLLRLANIASVNARSHAVINSMLVQVVTALETEGIHSILLKGQGVASLYHNPLLRMCGDIDLYVGVKNYTRAAHLLMKMAGQGVEYTESEKHFHIELNGVTVELHRIAERLFNPLQNREFQKWSVEHLQSEKTAFVKFGDATVHIPSAEFNAVYIFNHLWHHFLGGGVGLRQLGDWAMVLHTQPSPLNRNLILAQLKDFGLLNAWRTFGCIAVDKLGLSEDEFPLYDMSFRSKSIRVLDRILAEGNFGQYSTAYEGRPDGVIAGKLHTLRRISRRTASMAKVSPARVAEYYMHFLIHGIAAVPKAMRGIKTSYMDQDKGQKQKI